MKAVKCSVCGREQPIMKMEPLKWKNPWELRRQRWMVVESTGQVVCGGSPNEEDEHDECLRKIPPLSAGSTLTIFLPGMTGEVPSGVPTVVVQEGEPLCEKCGGKTVAALMPETFAIERKCVECEMEIVSRDKDGSPVHLVLRESCATS